MILRAMCPSASICASASNHSTRLLLASVGSPFRIMCWIVSIFTPISGPTRTGRYSTAPERLRTWEIDNHSGGPGSARPCTRLRHLYGGPGGWRSEGPRGAPGDGLRPAAFRLHPGWSQCAPGLRCGLVRLGEGPVAHHQLLE